MKSSTLTLLLMTALGAVTSCSTPPSGVDTQAAAVLQSMSDKLAAAKTLRVTATREASPGFHAGFDVAEKAAITAVAQRPNQINAQADTNHGRRSICYDGKTVTFVDHKAGTYAVVDAGQDIDSTARALEKTYGVMPPLVELLANQPQQFLLEGVTSARHLGTQSIDGTACDHLAFEQPFLSWELWVSTADNLPRKLVMTHPNGEGGAPLKLTLRIQKWELNTPVTPDSLKLSIPSNSTRVEMIPLTNS